MRAFAFALLIGGCSLVYDTGELRGTAADAGLDAAPSDAAVDAAIDTARPEDAGADSGADAGEGCRLDEAVSGEVTVPGELQVGVRAPGCSAELVAPEPYDVSPTVLSVAGGTTVNVQPLTLSALATAPAEAIVRISCAGCTQDFPIPIAAEVDALVASERGVVASPSELASVAIADTGEIVFSALRGGTIGDDSDTELDVYRTNAAGPVTLVSRSTSNPAVHPRISDDGAVVSYYVRGVHRLRATGSSAPVGTSNCGTCGNEDVALASLRRLDTGSYQLAWVDTRAGGGADARTTLLRTANFNSSITGTTVADLMPTSCTPDGSLRLPHGNAAESIVVLSEGCALDMTMPIGTSPLIWDDEGPRFVDGAIGEARGAVVLGDNRVLVHTASSISVDGGVLDDVSVFIGADARGDIVVYATSDDIRVSFRGGDGVSLRSTLASFGELLVDPTGTYDQAAISPDGAWAAFRVDVGTGIVEVVRVRL
ncbi:MAG: hypothetical protein AAGE52_13340 [Myxococcota bacterium]